MSEEQRITACKTAVGQIYTMLRSAPQQWPNFLTLARTVIAHLDSTTFMQQATRTTEQASIIATLQILSFKNFDSGATMDIYSWCSRQWLVILQRDAQNLAALRGLGQMWLSRSQPALARVHSSQDQASETRSGAERSTRSRVESSSEAERRIGAADYVEARGFLQPATEYFERSVTAAKVQSVLSGDLLAKSAEAYMSLGNVSNPRTNEQHFRRALQLLREASQVPGFALPPHLQKYLDDNGKLFK